MYQLSSPTLLILDPDLIKLVAVKDFEHFMDHRSIIPDNADPLWTRNLFALRGKLLFAYLNYKIQSFKFIYYKNSNFDLTSFMDYVSEYI